METIFHVLHRREPDFRPVQDEFKRQDFDLVAVVECSDIDDAFRLTNHIDQSWYNNENIVRVVKKSRSTSVGDIVYDVFGAKYMACDPIGWREVEPDFE